MTLSNARSHLNHWLEHNPSASVEQRINIEVLRANVAHYDRLKNATTRRRLAASLEQAARVLGCS